MTGIVVTESRRLIYPRGLMNPEDFMVFIHFGAFVNAWKELGLEDDDLRLLEVQLMSDPKQGDVIRGTNGLRKMRFAPQKWGKGKSGSVRIGYLHLEHESQICLIAVYAKGDKADLTAAERKQIATLITRLRRLLQKE